MLEVVGDAVRGKFALDGVAWAAHAGALGVASLDHESGDDPVEDGSVVEPIRHQGQEVPDRIGGQVRVELCPDGPA